MIYLLRKEHNTTGLKYLCKHKTDDWRTCYIYNGSGKHWKYHLKKHGRDISTDILFSTNDPIKFREEACRWSKLLNVVESKDWANLVEETGEGGVSNPCEEVRQKMREAKLGKLPWNKGKTRCFSLEVCRKMGESRKGQIHNLWTEKSRKKLSESMKGNRNSPNGRRGNKTINIL